MTEPPNPWAVLGLSEGAGLGEARRAFRRLAKHTHPDAGGDDRAFTEIVEAFRALRSSLPAEPARRRGPASPYDWVLRPEPPVMARPQRQPPRPRPRPRPDFASVLATEMARVAA